MTTPSSPAKSLQPVGADDPRARQPLPIHERIGADPRFTGRGVVAAFLDSGFFAHPDLITPQYRIRAYQDLMGRKRGVENLSQVDVSSWHGMMSTVIAAGNGWLSGGRFRSLAPQMDLVLIKVGSVSRIRHDDIARGIKWVLANRERYQIRILNISCGGDREVSYLEDPLSRLAESAVRAGIVVVSAVGNNGQRPGYVLPPASAPAVISVGGLDDSGNPRLGRVSGYHSSFGPTIDGLQKPEVITLAEWLAAPILPGTPTAEQASLLSRLSSAGDDALREILSQHPGVYPALDEAKDRPTYQLRQLIDAGLRDELVIDEHYKMVDGTSFAAPIVTSVVAQMLEANPHLSPQEAKRILIQTARRLPTLEVDRQGWGAVQPKAAVERALQLMDSKPAKP